MRQIASLDDERLAKRFAAFLVTQNISATAEPDDSAWSVWVREEDQLDAALRHYEQFKADPEAQSYRGAEQKAEAIERDEKVKRQKAQRNVVEMRSNWSKNAFSGPRPLTITLIVISVMVFMITGFEGAKLSDSSPVTRALWFLDPIHLVEAETPIQPGSDEFDSLGFRMKDILHGQVWRLVTPIFMHGGIGHIFMNMWTLWVLGSPVERKYGTVWYGLLVLALAIPSTLCGSIAPYELDGSPFGIGMSGVLFGLFGFMWMKSLFDPSSGFRIPPIMLIMIGAFLLIGLTTLDEQLLGARIDNWAHIIGLLTGMAIGYAPVLFKQARRP